mgnify:CR=1 FL=1
MYVIINIHWDGGWLENNPTYAQQDAVNAKQEAYWLQIAEYFADYAQWLQYKKDSLSDTSRSGDTSQRPRKKKSGKSTYEARKELNRIEKQIETAEGLADQLQRQLHDPKIMCDADQLAKRYAQHQDAQKKVEQLYERWEELMES